MKINYILYAVVFAVMASAAVAVTADADSRDNGPAGAEGISKFPEASFGRPGTSYDLDSRNMRTNENYNPTSTPQTSFEPDNRSPQEPPRSPLDREMDSWQAR